MRTRIPYNNFEELERDVIEVIGEELYNECAELRNKPSKFGHHFTRFIKKTENRVTFHFNRTAHEKLYDYVFDNRNSALYDAFVHGLGEGYKMTFLLEE